MYAYVEKHSVGRHGNCIEGPGFTAEGETTDRRERRLVGRSVEAQRGKQRRVFHDEWGTTERRESQGGK